MVLVFLSPAGREQVLDLANGWKAVSRLSRLNGAVRHEPT